MDWADEVKPRSRHSGVTGIDAILKDARRGDLVAVKSRLKEQPALLNAKSCGHNRSFLWEAVRGNRVSVVRHLLKQGADPNVPGRVRAEIPVLLPSLAIARRYRRTSVEPLLIRAGAIIDFPAACFLGDMDLVTSSLNANPALLREEIAYESVWRVTALHYAVAGDQPELTHHLIARGAVVRPYTRLLFNIASRVKDGDVIFNLLVDAGADQSLADAWY